MDNYVRSFFKKTESLKTKQEKFAIENMPSGTKILVETHNSTYEMEIIEQFKVLIKGGFLSENVMRFPEPSEAIVISGCEIGMRMQVFCNDLLISTSPVKRLTVITIASLKEN